jgi:hypothetical protein
MKDSTPEEKRAIALNVNAKKNLRPEWIYDTDEIVAQFREYARREALARYEEDNPTSNRHREMTADIVSELSADQIEYHMPALVFFFKRYLTQH